MSIFVEAALRTLLVVLLVFCGVARAGELRVAVSQLPPTLGNPFTSIGTPGSEVASLVFDTLTMIGQDGVIHPGLALSWTNETPTRWVFKLRPGGMFHNGKPVNAAAVAASLQLLKESTTYLVSAELRGATDIKARDDSTVEIVTKEPDAILPRRMNVIFIVEASAWREMGADQFALKPVGAGPFKLVDWGKDKGFATLEKHVASWRAPKSVDRLIYRAVYDTAARAQALTSGRVDMALGFAADDIAPFEAAGFRTTLNKTPNIMSIALPNMLAKDSPLTKRDVRLALNYAVDREGIAKHIIGGLAPPATQGATPGTFGYNPDLKLIPYDPKKAKEMLAAAGYPNGFSLTMGVLTNLATTDALVFQKVAQDLGAVGVKVEVIPLTFADYVRQYASGNWNRMNAFSALWNNAPYGDVIRGLEAFSCLKTNPYFCDESVAKDVAASSREMDPAKREKMLQAIMARLHDEVIPAIWLTNHTTVIATTKLVKRFAIRPSGVAFEEIELAN